MVLGAFGGHIGNGLHIGLLKFWRSGIYQTDKLCVFGALTSRPAEGLGVRQSP